MVDWIWIPITAVVSGIICFAVGCAIAAGSNSDSYIDTMVDSGHDQVEDNPIGI